MPYVRNIRVYTLDRDALTVTWEIGETQDDLSLYTVSVWRSESAVGPYARVSMEMISQDVYDFEDRGVNLYSKWREFFYRIRLTKVSDQTYVDFGSVDYRKVLDGADPGGVISEAPPDLEALESIRRFDLVLREYAGRRVLVLSERTWGQRCPNCWDYLKRRRTLSGCPQCFDVGISGGYFSPAQAFAMKPAGQQLVQLTPLFELQPNDQVMILSSKPRVKPRDIVIDIDGRRWRILSVSRSEKGWSLTRQTVQVRMISRDQAEYKIPVQVSDWSVDSLSAGAVRQQIRATDIESYYQRANELGVANKEIFAPTSEIATNLEDSDAEQ